jgi:hypothetical protein
LPISFHALKVVAIVIIQHDQPIIKATRATATDLSDESGDSWPSDIHHSSNHLVKPPPNPVSIHQIAQHGLDIYHESIAESIRPTLVSSPVSSGGITVE